MESLRPKRDTHWATTENADVN